MVLVIVYSLSHDLLFAIPGTVARQASLSMLFPRQKYWSGLPFLPPGDLPDPGIKLPSLRSTALVGKFFITSNTWEAQYIICVCTSESDRKCSSFILLQVADQFSQHHLLKRLSFLHSIFLPPLSKIRCP